MHLSITPYQCGLVRTWNAVANSLPRRKWDHSLSFDSIVASVQKKTGDTVFQAGTALLGLEKLLESLDDTGNLHSFGRFYVRALLKSLLLNRLNLTALWNGCPSFLQDEIKKPIIVLGLPRSGTSFFFNLLAQDPAHRFLSNWETTVSQVPPSGSYIYAHDPRRRKGRYLMRFQNYLVPHLGDIHQFYLDGPEECTPILMQEFTTQALAGMFRVPGYSQWLNRAPRIETYKHHKRVLQTLQWKYPGDRWLLKSPDHIAAVSEILEVYPDACIIHLHRDPAKSVTSWASLNAAFRGIYTKTIDMHELGSEVTDRLAEDITLYLTKRRTLPSIRFFDTLFIEVVRDPMAVVRRAYSYFGLNLSEEAEQRMLAYISNNRSKKTTHRYDSIEFGINDGAVTNRFVDYINVFQVPHEG